MASKKWDHRPEQLAAYRGTPLELIPLHVPDALDRKGRKIGKAPLGKRWRTDPQLTVDEAVSHMRAEGNAGVRLRAEDLVVDVDPRNFREGDDPLARLEADLGFELRARCPTVVTGSGGLHLYLTKPADASLRDTLEDYQGIEFKSLGRQVVAPGSVHPDTGRPYLWDELSPPLSKTPAAPAFLLSLAARPGRTAAVDAGSRSPEELGEMLAGLDAEDFQDHTRWLELMMACHHATAGEGRDEFIEFSTSDPKYAGDGWSIGRRWDSLHSDGNGRRVTEKTLFKELVRKGRAELLPRATAEEDFGDDAQEVQDDYDVSHLPEGDPANGPLEALNAKGYCAVNDRGVFRIFRLRPDYEWPDDDKRTYWETYKKGDFMDILSNVRIQTEDGRVVSVSQEWLRWGGRTSYDGVVFDPGRRIPKSARVLNLWTDWAVEPKKGDWSLLQELLHDGLAAGDTAFYEYAVDWAAHMIQRPDQQAEVAVIFKGQKGTGKGTWGKALTKLAGRHGMHISSQHHFTNHFNAHLRDCLFLFADEAIWAGDKRAEGELKRLITEPTLLFEAKGKDAVTGKNMLHVMMASNEDWVAPASLEDERRFAVTEVSDKYRGNRAFFDALYKQLYEQGGLGALLFDLKKRDLRGFHPRARIPATRALAEQKLTSLDHLDAWWYECLCRGSLGQGRDPIPLPGHLDSLQRWDGGGVRPRFFLAQDLRDSYEDHLGQMRVRGGGASRRSLQTQMGDRLKRRVSTARAVKIKPPADRFDVECWSDGRCLAYALPSLEECRSMFEAQLGSKMDWLLSDEADLAEDLAVDAEELDPLWS